MRAASAPPRYRRRQVLIALGVPQRPRAKPPCGHIRDAGRRLAAAASPDTVAEVAAKRVEVEIDGRTLSLSNLGKVMYPRAGFTKGQVIDYYSRIAPVLLPHLRGRPLTLKRYPEGVEGGHFYEKQCPRHRPDWVRTAAVWSRHNGRNIDFCL